MSYANPVIPVGMLVACCCQTDITIVMLTSWQHNVAWTIAPEFRLNYRTYKNGQPYCHVISFCQIFSQCCNHLFSLLLNFSIFESRNFTAY